MLGVRQIERNLFFLEALCVPPVKGQYNLSEFQVGNATINAIKITSSLVKQMNSLSIETTNFSNFVKIAF